MQLVSIKFRGERRREVCTLQVWKSQCGPLLSRHPVKLPLFLLLSFKSKTSGGISVLSETAQLQICQATCIRRCRDNRDSRGRAVSVSLGLFLSAFFPSGIQLRASVFIRSGNCRIRRDQRCKNPTCTHAFSNTSSWIRVYAQLSQRRQAQLVTFWYLFSRHSQVYLPELHKKQNFFHTLTCSSVILFPQSLVLFPPEENLPSFK